MERKKEKTTLNRIDGRRKRRAYTRLLFSFDNIDDLQTNEIHRSHLLEVWSISITFHHWNNNYSVPVFFFRRYAESQPNFFLNRLESYLMIVFCKLGSKGKLFFKLLQDLK